MNPSPRPTAAQAAGGAAEDRAARHLEDHGLHIVARNYRTRMGEIDVIARDGEVLVFVEVRMRSGEGFGGALESVTPRKQRRIAAAASLYLSRLPRAPRCRFDVVALGGPEPVWVRAAFECS